MVEMGWVEWKEGLCIEGLRIQVHTHRCFLLENGLPDGRAGSTGWLAGWLAG